ncbi:MAG: threonine ammonia-lyase [Alphaproteobacteria bacterium]|nr:threonine ammonia-lyase [Alphaproteobacteria bacterium]
MSVSIADIHAAAETMKGAVARTPLVRAGALSDRFGADIFLKLETLNHTGSFKDRGALVKLQSLTPEQRKRGVIAISAGNHAQGVAYHAQRLSIPATIVMPEGTPFNKVLRTEALGARVILIGDNINASEPHAKELAARENLTFVHPYDDEKIIAGQGVIGLEMLADAPELDIIIAPIGGGGLISGIATAAKAIKPSIEIIGAEADLYPSMYQALRGLTPTSNGASIAEGIAVKSPGVLTRDIIERLVEDIILVDEAAIEASIQTMLSEAKVLCEGAGAVPLAALRQDPDRFAGKSVGLVVTGANIDPRILASVLLRSMVRNGQMAQLRVTISDKPGALAAVSNIIANSGGNIVEIYHQRLFFDLPVKMADLDVTLETRGVSHVAEILKELGAAGYPARQLIDADRI